MNENEALQRSESYCTAAERCIVDVQTKLERWQVDSPTAQRIVKRLIEEKFIDEQRYARAFVHDKLMFCHWGRMKIALGLKQKQIVSEVLREALDAIDDDEYEAVLRQVIRSKKKEVRYRTDYERSVKLLKSVAARGFEVSLIKKYIDIPEQTDL